MPLFFMITLPPQPHYSPFYSSRSTLVQTMILLVLSSNTHVQFIVCCFKLHLIHLSHHRACRLSENTETDGKAHWWHTPAQRCHVSGEHCQIIFFLFIDRITFKKQVFFFLKSIHLPECFLPTIDTIYYQKMKLKKYSNFNLPRTKKSYRSHYHSAKHIRLQ